MSAEFIDTNILVYAHDGGAGAKHRRSVELLRRVMQDGTGALSIQVLVEFYIVATKKLGMRSQEAEAVLADLGTWAIHRPRHADLISAAGLERRHKISWWDALIIHSAAEMGCTVLWTEDLSDGQKFGTVRVRCPFP